MINAALAIKELKPSKGVMYAFSFPTGARPEVTRLVKGVGSAGKEDGLPAGSLGRRGGQVGAHRRERGLGVR